MAHVIFGGQHMIAEKLRNTMKPSTECHTVFGSMSYRSLFDIWSD